MQPLLRSNIVFIAVLLGLTLGSCSNSKKAKTSHKGRTEQSDSQKGASELYAFVDAWQGVPYRYGGTTRSGVDCSGFVGTLYREVYQKEIPRTTKAISSECKTVARTKLREGDLVFFDIEGKKDAHVGVYLRNGDFVHASSSKGVIVSNLENPYYQRAFAKGGRL